MAILNFDDKDKLVTQKMPDGYYSLEVVEIKDPVKSGSGKSFNFHSTFRVINDEKWDGKELELFFNTKTKNASVMGTLQILPHTMILELVAATAGCTLEEVPNDLDTESLKGLKFDAHILKVISEGVVLNTIASFLPFGTGQAKQTEASPF